MYLLAAIRIACLSAGVMLASTANAESLASSASSAGSQSSGSVSDSLHGSSRSSSGNDKRADADYRIIDIAGVADRPGFARLTLQSEGESDDEALLLDLPEAIVAREALVRGDRVQARRQVYGFQFARGDRREPFFLVLNDDWFDGLEARPVGL